MTRTVHHSDLVQNALDTLSQPNWTLAWRSLARDTEGLRAEDPRLAPVRAAVDRCDIAYHARDWGAFQRAAYEARMAMRVENHSAHTETIPQKRPRNVANTR